MANVDLSVDIIIIELFEERVVWSHRCQAMEVNRAVSRLPLEILMGISSSFLPL